MPDDFPMEVIVFGDSCPNNKVDCPQGNGPKGVVTLEGSCPSG